LQKYFSIMKPDDIAKRLRIYISSTDKFEHKPLYEVIVYSARSYGITGATVLKGIMGYGASSEIYSDKLWEISEKIPLVVEIIDEPEKIDSFIDSIKPFFDKIGKGHIITVDETTIIRHNPGIKK
jgi:PII-like signaling protein